MAQDLSETTTGTITAVPIASCITIGRTGAKATFSGQSFDDWHINIRQHKEVALPDGSKVNVALPDISMNLSEIIDQPNVYQTFNATFELIVAMMAGRITPPQTEEASND